MGELNAAVALRNLTVLSGGEKTVSYAGFSAGGGHGALSPTYGMAADQILELELITPSGDIVIANECINSDLFWAMRGVSSYSPRNKLKLISQGRRFYIWSRNLNNHSSVSIKALHCLWRINHYSTQLGTFLGCYDLLAFPVP